MHYSNRETSMIILLILFSLHQLQSHKLGNKILLRSTECPTCGKREKDCTFGQSINENKICTDCLTGQ